MTGFVYAIESGDLIKVGYSTNPPLRLTKLQSAIKAPCRLLGYIPATAADEREIHRALKGDCFRGEWFHRGSLVSHFLSTITPYQKPEKKRRLSKLATYMEAQGLNDADMAARIGHCSAAAVDKWRRGLRVPRPEQMRRIQEATAGCVMANDFFAAASSDKDDAA